MPGTRSVNQLIYIVADEPRIGSDQLTRIEQRWPIRKGVWLGAESLIGTFQDVLAAITAAEAAWEAASNPEAPDEIALEELPPRVETIRQDLLKSTIQAYFGLNPLPPYMIILWALPRDEKRDPALILALRRAFLDYSGTNLGIYRWHPGKAARNDAIGDWVPTVN